MNTLHQINQQAQKALRDALEPVDYTRYQQQFSQGVGDYTAERQQKSQTSIATISERVAGLKASGRLIPPPHATVME